MHLLKKYAKRGAGICSICLLAFTTMASAAQLPLDQAVNMALENNSDIKISANAEKTAEYTLQGAKGRNGISLGASNSWNLKNSDEISSTSSSGINLSLPLYTGGKNEGNINIAQTNVKIAELDSLKTQQDVKLKTTMAYYDVIQAHQNQAVAQETVNNNQLHLDNVNAQYSAGTVAKADVLRSEVELTNAQQNLLQAKKASDVAVNNLKNLLRWQDSADPELVEEFDCVPFEFTMDESVEYAKTHRPDLEKVQLTIQTAQEGVNVAKADEKPSVSLKAGASWNNIMPTDHSDTYVGLTSSWNLFDSQVTQSAIKKAQTAVDTAQLNLTSQEDAVTLAVKEDYLGMKEAEQRRQTTETAINKAQEDYDIAVAKYQAGDGITLDVLDAQLALATAKNNYIKAQYDYAVDKAKLENAMGME